MPLDVPKFMNALVSDLQSDAWDRDVRLVLDATTSMSVHLDESTLRNALSTLLEALVHGSEPDSTIAVVTRFEAVESQAGTLHLIVTAPLAVEAADAPRLALALAPLQHLAAAHSGLVATTSETASWICTVELPATVAGNVVATGQVALVVDDDVDMQDFLRAVLEVRGFRVVAVNDGFDALIAIERTEPAVVLTDVLMPNMNGIDLVGRIKATRKDLPVIVFSGYHDVLTKRSETPYGPALADYVLTKPMTQLQIVAAVDAVLGVRV